ncbi:MAG: molybdenum transporter, periplasmic molybdate-binding protein [Microbacteriaceae bacterium]|jgi:molybdate transport system substrate-binding protein|nr:molybdenum transporter, periplasmic molybdate-binding protein [Microbacteriaceae bacterium]
MRMLGKRAGVFAVVVLIGIAVSGCGANAPERQAPAGLHGTIVVDAASSLTDTFRRLGAQFHAANPGVTVTFNFGASSALATQIVSGAPADVFAAANPATMKTVTDAAETSGTPTIFVRNRLEIAVPPGNPGRITGLADFADPAKTIALCAVEVPCGAAAATVFARAGLTPRPDTLEQDVAAALTKVELDEVDAALVYRTDVISAGDKVTGIPFPEAADAINGYPIAALKGSGNPKAAAAFVKWVLSKHGRSLLSGAGFDLP